MPKKITTQLIGFMQGMREGGATLADISARVGVHRTTVAEYTKAGFKAIVQQKQRARAPTQFQRQRTKRAKAARALAKKIKKIGGRATPAFPTARRIAAELSRQGTFGNVSRKTVHRDLKKMNMKSLVRPKITFNNAKFATRRLTFIRDFSAEHGDIVAATERIVFSDEHFVTTNDYTSRTQWVDEASGLLPRAVLNRLNTIHAMIWAAVGVGFKSHIVFVDTSIDAETGRQRRLDARGYLQRVLRSSPRRGAPTVMQYLVRNGRIFMQDGARIHTASVVTSALDRAKVNYIKEWPAHSPDMNPIERVWSIVNSKLAEYPPASTVEELKRQVEEVWDSIPQHTIDRTVRSFAGTMADVRKRKGW